jgi:predicted nucleic acid-binding protein
LFIDHLRARDKTSTLLADVLSRFTMPSTSTVVQYEVELGMTDAHRELWSRIRKRLTIFPFESSMALQACKIRHSLKAKGKQIEIADLFIAATAIVCNMPLATLNRKHFEPIENLKLIAPN